MLQRSWVRISFRLERFFQMLISQLLKLCITAMINHVFISFSAVQIYALSYIHLYFSQSMGILQTHKVTSSQLASDSSFGSALHLYHTGHEFESRSILISFQALISQPLKLCIQLQ